jgi:hypothetical protein
VAPGWPTVLFFRSPSSDDEGGGVAGLAALRLDLVARVPRDVLGIREAQRSPFP